MNVIAAGKFAKQTAAAQWLLLVTQTPAQFYKGAARAARRRLGLCNRDGRSGLKSHKNKQVAKPGMGAGHRAAGEIIFLLLNIYLGWAAFPATAPDADAESCFCQLTRLSLVPPAHSTPHRLPVHFTHSKLKFSCFCDNSNLRLLGGKTVGADLGPRTTSRIK